MKSNYHSGTGQGPWPVPTLTKGTMKLTIKKQLCELSDKGISPFYEPWEAMPLDALSKTELILIIKALQRKAIHEKAKILAGVRRACSKD